MSLVISCLQPVWDLYRPAHTGPVWDLTGPAHAVPIQGSGPEWDLAGLDQVSDVTKKTGEVCVVNIGLI